MCKIILYKYKYKTVVLYRPCNTYNHYNTETNGAHRKCIEQTHQYVYVQCLFKTLSYLILFPEENKELEVSSGKVVCDGDLYAHV